MNYLDQSKRIKPNAKCCDWCTHLYKCHEVIFGEDIEVEKCKFDNTPMHPKTTHRQDLKIIREQEFRYCKNFRYSKTNFKSWKKFREENAKLQRFCNEELEV